MASPRSANRRRSPGRIESKSSGMPSPARTCSREVRGSPTPFFAKTYFVKPEQSKPFGVLPPQTYFTPTYWSAVLSTRAAAALAEGERGMRTVDDPRDEPLEPPLRELALITRPARTTPSRMVPGETASVPCAQAERTSMAEGTTAMGRTRMHDMVLRGYGVDGRRADDEQPCSRQLRRHGSRSA